MLTIRFLGVALALLVAPLLLAGDACAQQPAPTAPATVPPLLAPRNGDKPPRPPDITFYVAHGEPNTCSVGCGEWIAGEGTIDRAAPARLHRLLDALGARQPPIFLDSPGGEVGPSLQLGRLLRERRMEVSIGRTIPRECDPDKLVATTCGALKRSGRELEAKLDLTDAICASGCVWAFAGGAVRQIPPWVRLGVHDVGFGLDEAPQRNANLAGQRSVVHSRMALYLGQMGLNYGVYSAALAVPFESLRFLDREETIRFGLDTRTFAETVWIFGDKPAAGVTKQYFGPSGNPELPYPNATVQLSCAAGGATRLSIAHQRVPQQATPGVPAADPPPPASAPPLHVTIGGSVST